MKTAALLLASLIFASFSGAASAHGLGEADIRNLAEAYGYVEYQKTAFTESLIPTPLSRRMFFAFSAVSGTVSRGPKPR